MMLPFCALAQQSGSQLQPQFYLGANLDRFSLGNSSNTGDTNAELQPVIAMAQLGYWLRPGIGLELEAGAGVVSDSVGTLDLDFTSVMGANVRLESQPISRFAAYAVVGYVRSSYDLSSDGFDTSITLPGGRLAFGMTYILNRYLQLDGGFSHHDYDGDTRINSFRLGIRYETSR